MGLTGLVDPGFIIRFGLLLGYGCKRVMGGLGLYFWVGSDFGLDNNKGPFVL